MTADEIRRLASKLMDRLKELDTAPNEMTLAVLTLVEIAAQLAELNAGLASALAHTHMVTYKPDTGVDDDD